jgi:hypothetical protein
LTATHWNEPTDRLSLNQSLLFHLVSIKIGSILMWLREILSKSRCGGLSWTIKHGVTLASQSLLEEHKTSSIEMSGGTSVPHISRMGPGKCSMSLNSQLSFIITNSLFSPLQQSWEKARNIF